MALREIQKKAGVFEASNDALCFGLSFSELNYLSVIKVEAVVMEGLKDASMLKTKFNVMVLALDLSIFRVFGIIERYIDTLLTHAKVIVKLKVETDLDGAKNVVAQLARPLNLQPEQYVEAEDGVWLILTRICL
ncbi:MAG: hypothetical protein ABIG84_02360 [archaeon]